MTKNLRKRPQKTLQKTPRRKRRLQLNLLKRKRRQKSQKVSQLLKCIDPNENEVKLDSSSSDSGEGSESEGEGSESSNSPSHAPDDLERKRDILFEDEMFAQQCKEVVMAYEDFQEYIEEFVDHSCAKSQQDNDTADTDKDIAHRKSIDFAIVDLNHEFADELSDDVPLSQLKNTNNTDKLSKKLQKTIAEYENLLEKDLFKDANERNNTRKLLRSLKSQLESHINTKGVKNKKEVSIEEQRELALQEIFSFYAKQHIPPGLAFEDLEETLHTINIGELLVFCKDFGLKIPRNQLMLVYKRESENNQPHRFKQFKQTLRKISEILQTQKVTSTQKRLKEIRHALGEFTVKATETATKKSSESESGEGESSKSGSGDEKEEVNKNEVVKETPAKEEPAKGKKPPAQFSSPKGKKAPVKLDSPKGKKDAKKDPIETKETEKSKKTDKKSEKKSEKTSEKKSESEESDGKGSESGSDSDSEKSKSVKNSNQGDDSSNSESSDNNKLNEERDKLDEELEELESKTKDEIFEDFIKFLEIDDPQKYKRKAKGLRLAFDVKDTKSRIPI